MQLIIDADDPAAIKRLAAAARREQSVRLTRTFANTNPKLPGLLSQIHQWQRRPTLHFIGVNNPDSYRRACLIFGEPDFVHRTWDVRAAAEIMPGDVAIFGTHKDGTPYDADAPASLKTCDDSAQADDPATFERRD